MQKQPIPTAENEAAALNCSGAWTADGYIKDQDLLTGYTYRTIPAMQNSCGPVAVFNLCRRTGKKVSFDHLLKEMDGMHMMHIPGPTFMYVMRKVLTFYLPGWQEVHGRDEAVDAAEHSSMGIFRYHEKHIPHFVGYFRQEGDTFRFFNVDNEIEDSVMSIQEFAAGHLLGGSVKLIWWEEEE